jgi:hypothetical protein
VSCSACSVATEDGNIETPEDWLEFKVLEITVAVVSFVIVMAATGEEAFDELLCRF